MGHGDAAAGRTDSPRSGERGVWSSKETETWDSEHGILHVFLATERKAVIRKDFDSTAGIGEKSSPP